MVIRARNSKKKESKNNRLNAMKTMLWSMQHSTLMLFLLFFSVQKMLLKSFMCYSV
jgi:hypothetical protein